MTLLIYGAYGYTGKLITEELDKFDFEEIILAGRNEEKVNKLSTQYNLKGRVFDLEDSDVIEENIKDITVVLHCAGPFSVTAEPMMLACIETKTHYLDITGEINVFELAKQLNTQAKEAGIILMPGVGFDVVPTDCLSLKLKKEMPDAEYLELAFHGLGGSASVGTQKTSFESMRYGFYIREGGKLKQVPILYDTKTIEFNTGKEHLKRLTMTIPWGDVSTAYHTTGIPNISVYRPVHPSRIKTLKFVRLIRPLLGWKPVQKFVKWRIGRGEAGPSEEDINNGKMLIWGRAFKEENDEQKEVQIDMITPNGYVLTKNASLVIANKILTGDYEPGFHTPAALFSDSLLDELEGIEFPE